MQTITLGAHIRQLRRGKRWTLRALAEASGLSISHLSRIENDSVSPNVESVLRLAGALDGDLFEMLAMSGSLSPDTLGRIRRPPEWLRASATRGEGERDASDAIGGLRGTLDALGEAISRLEALVRRMEEAQEPRDVRTEDEPPAADRIIVVVEAPASVEEVASLQARLLSMRGVVSARIRAYGVEAAELELACAGTPDFSCVPGWAVDSAGDASAARVVARRA